MLNKEKTFSLILSIHKATTWKYLDLLVIIYEQLNIKLVRHHQCVYWLYYICNVLYLKLNNITICIDSFSCVYISELVNTKHPKKTHFKKLYSLESFQYKQLKKAPVLSAQTFENFRKEKRFCRDDDVLAYDERNIYHK